MKNTLWAGIDYGSKMAGTTVIAMLDPDERIVFRQSEKKKDADQFVLQWVKEQKKPFPLFLDAPLSLPLVYRNAEKGDDYFYRQADRAVQAMSPMFLGGLTARAMRLHRQLDKMGCAVHEVYPGYLARKWQLKDRGYKNQKQHIPAVVEAINTHQPFSFLRAPENWHQVDALLAFLSGYRFFRQEHLQFGSSAEGYIIV